MARSEQRCRPDARDRRRRRYGYFLRAGASTGGFTQVCLDRGATRVYAVDVGHGQLAEPISAHPRVVVHEGLNLRDLTLDHLDGAPVDAIP